MKLKLDPPQRRKAIPGLFQKLRHLLILEKECAFGLPELSPWNLMKQWQLRQEIGSLSRRMDEHRGIKADLELILSEHPREWEVRERICQVSSMQTQMMARLRWLYEETLLEAPGWRFLGNPKAPRVAPQSFTPGRPLDGMEAEDALTVMAMLRDYQSAQPQFNVYGAWIRGWDVGVLVFPKQTLGRGVIRFSGIDIWSENGTKTWSHYPLKSTTVRIATYDGEPFRRELEILETGAAFLIHTWRHPDRGKRKRPLDSNLSWKHPLSCTMNNSPGRERGCCVRYLLAMLFDRKPPDMAEPYIKKKEVRR